jgi:Cysteine-rich CWC
MVKLALTWSRFGPTVKRPATCESCGQPFACELSLAGCWCSKVALTDATRAEMRAKHANCLCPACLEHYSQRGVSA